MDSLINKVRKEVDSERVEVEEKMKVRGAFGRPGGGGEEEHRAAR